MVLASATGAMGVAAAGDLVTLLVAIETVSLPAFALVGLRRDGRGAEAALKFFLVSVVATAFSLLGISMVYGATGSVIARPVAHAGVTDTAVTPVIGVAMMLTVVALAFKVAVVPFQAWVPDTYVGAPIPVAAYLSVVSKAAGLAGLVIVLVRFFPSYDEELARRRRCRRRLDDERGQPGGAAPAARGAAARLVVGGPGGLSAGPVGGRRRGAGHRRAAVLLP